MDKRLLTEDHRAFGQWYVLGHEDDLHAGELTYSPGEGIRLDLVGFFGDLPPFVPGAAESYNIVLGRTKNEEITLYGCDQVNKTYNFLGEGSTSYRVQFALFGASDRDESGTFDATEIRAQIPVLDAWLPITGLSTELAFNDAGAGVDHYVNRYDSAHATKTEIAMPWGTVTLSPVANFGGPPSTVNREAHIREWFTITFTLTSATSVADVLDERIWPLVDLATLLTLRPAELDYLAVMAPVRNPDGTLRDRRQALDVLYPVVSVKGKGEEKALSEDTFLLRPDNPSTPSFEEIVARWYASRDRYKRAMDVVFGMERSPRGTYTEVRFLMLCHAAEALHRDMPLPQRRYSEAEYRTLQRESLSAVQDERARSFLKEQLRYACDLTLRDRLGSLRAYALDDQSSLVDDEIIGRIARARNSLTHSSTKDVAELEETAGLFYLTVVVTWLLRACFMRELGLSCADVAEVLKSTDRFNWAIRRLGDDEN